jgi:tRNA(Ile)-lysidine synthase
VRELLRHVAGEIRARRLFRSGQSILVAVSGGVDSMVLLHALHLLSEENGWRLTVAHFNHCLRGRSSDADERLVKGTAAKLKLPFVVERADVRRYAAEQRLSLEMAARKLRHAFLARAAAQRRIPTIALAHHAGDQSELFFLRLLRGSGSEGLAGMKRQSPSPENRRLCLVRPLLDIQKAALSEFAAQNKIPFREDATNRTVEFRRNRIRHELLPLLRKEYQPALDRILPRTMETLGAEAEFVTETARCWLRGNLQFAPGGGDTPDAGIEIANRDFSGLPVAVQRRCLQFQLIELGVMPEFDLIELLRLRPNRPVDISSSTAGEEVGSTDLMVPISLLRSSDGLIQTKIRTPEAGFNLASRTVNLKGRGGKSDFEGVRVWWRFSVSRSKKQPTRVAQQEFFDAERVGSTVVLRHWRAGDRFQPIGMQRAVKLQDIFVNQKVLREHRPGLLVATTWEGEIFWVEGLRIAERFKLTVETKRRLQWRWQRL